MKSQRPALLPVPKLVMSLVAAITVGVAAYAAEPVKPADAKPPAPAAAKAPPAESAAPKADESSAEAGKAVGENATAPKDDKTAAAAAEDAEGETAPKSPADKGKGPSPQRFVPSEQVRADFDVSFPIDI